MNIVHKVPLSLQRWLHLLETSLTLAACTKPTWNNLFTPSAFKCKHCQTTIMMVSQPFSVVIKTFFWCSPSGVGLPGDYHEQERGHVRCLGLLYLMIPPHCPAPHLHSFPGSLEPKGTIQWRTFQLIILIVGTKKWQQMWPYFGLESTSHGHL